MTHDTVHCWLLSWLQVMTHDTVHCWLLSWLQVMTHDTVHCWLLSWLQVITHDTLLLAVVMVTGDDYHAVWRLCQDPRIQEKWYVTEIHI